MMEGFMLSVILSFIPAFFYAWILYWLDRYEKEPKLLLGGVFIWGAVVATIGAIIASLILQVSVVIVTGSETFADLTGTTIIAPIVEESLKGGAVLLVFLVFRKEFDSVLDGMIYAGITALGFAATENVLYLFSNYNEEGLPGLLFLFLLRVILGGWNHPVYTACIGIGLAISRLNKHMLIKLVAPIVGWIVAIIVHGLHNTMSSFLGGFDGLAAILLVDWLGWLFMAGLVIWAINREKRWLIAYLPEEVERGIMTQKQFDLACSSWAQTNSRMQALFSGRYRSTKQFYRVCAELAQKKHQLAMFGDEGGNRAIIEQLRGELTELSPRAKL